MQIPVLYDIEIIFGLSILVLLVFLQLRVPSIVGFLITGMIAGPHGLELVKGVHEVEVMAEIGVVLLLFTIGLEFSFKQLLQIRKSVLLGGSLQVGLTVLFAFLTAQAFTPSFGRSIFIGFLIALSSTAIVLKILQEKAAMDSPHGRATLGILIYQDLAIVPMMLATPFLAGASGETGGSLGLFAVKAGGLIVALIALAKWIVPTLFYQVARTRNRELFMLTVLGACLTVAWLTSSVGLSLALGAFLAGLIISESEYSHAAFGNILPFRDVFASFFFVSIGMLLDFRTLLSSPGTVVLLLAMVCAIKMAAAAGAVLVLRYPLRTALLSAAALCQVGEFSFILAASGLQYNLLSRDDYQLFLAISIITMLLTPFIIAVAPRLTDALLKLPLPEKVREGLYYQKPQPVEARKHLLIIGYGVNGKNVALAAKAAGIPYVIIEMNPDTVKKEALKGEPIYYGDATHEAVLEHAEIKSARVLVISIPDAAATQRITGAARKLNPTLHIIARTRFLQEIESLHELGANEVIPEEFETSIEIFSRVLKKYLIPREEIDRFIAEIRSGSYEMLRSVAEDPTTFCDLQLHMPDEEIITVRVEPGAPADGQSLAALELRKQYGVSVLAIRKGTSTLSNPDGDAVLRQHDVVVMLGRPEKISTAMRLFRHAPAQ
jgi:monovalent cation:H+ antiporter-2, CPA2 family